MANDYKNLWRKEVEKINRQIHKYEKEGVRFIYKPIEEDTAKKKYTQADVDIVKVKRLTLFEGAEMFDDETFKTYRGKEQIVNRIRQRNEARATQQRNYQTQQQIEKDIKKPKTKNDKPSTDKILVDTRETKEIASLQDTIYMRAIDFLSTFNVYQEFKGRSEWYYQEKEKQRMAFIQLFGDITNVVGQYKFMVALNDSYELFEDLKAVMYDSSEFSDTPATTNLYNLLYNIGKKTDDKNINPLINNFMDKYGIDETDFEIDFNDTF